MQHFENYCIYDFELEIWVQTKSLFENQFDPGPIKEKFWVQFFFFLQSHYNVSKSFEQLWGVFNFRFLELTSRDYTFFIKIHFWPLPRKLFKLF